MTERAGSGLIRVEGERYGDSFGSDLLEQYKLYVQSAESVSARRLASSRYLLTLNAALAALYGLQPAGFGRSHWALLVPGIGIAVCLLWRSIIKSHADLNGIKFEVVHEFERHLPAAPYAYEWFLAKRGRGKAYREATSLERWVPVLFAVLHAGLAVAIVLGTVGILD